jgi:DNA-binding PadR family transcriptional regulator
MDSPLSAQAALLQALALPGHGLELAERVRRDTRGQVRLGPGSVYPALRALEGRGWIRTRATSRKAAGRPGVVYELTPEGVAAAAAQREALAAFYEPRPDVRSSPIDVPALRERLVRTARASSFVLRLRSAVQAASARR